MSKVSLMIGISGDTMRDTYSGSKHMSGMNEGSPHSKIKQQGGATSIASAFLTLQGGFASSSIIQGLLLDQFPQVNEVYTQLSLLVEQLETRVEGVIERHDAEFLVAYKNQMNKIQKELHDMKSKMDEQDKRLKAGGQLADVEKQLSLFRDESLKLYEKLGARDRQISDFKQILIDQRKEIEESESQIALLKQKVRQLAKKSSELNNYNDDDGFQNKKESYIISTEDKYHTGLRQRSAKLTNPNRRMTVETPFESSTNATRRPESSSVYGIMNSGNFIKNQQRTAALHQQQPLQGDYIAELVSRYATSDPIRLTGEISNLLKREEEKRIKQVKVVKDKLDKARKETVNHNVVRSDLERFFFECIEAVRKQIIKRSPAGQPRKTDGQLNFYLDSIKDYSVFRAEDKCRILEMLVSNEKLLLLIYQKLFPQSFVTTAAAALQLQNHVNRQYSQQQPQIDIAAVISVEDINKETDQLAKIIENVGNSGFHQHRGVKGVQMTSLQVAAAATLSRRRASINTLKSSLHSRNQSSEMYKEFIYINDKSRASSSVASNSDQSMHHYPPPQVKLAELSSTKIQFKVQ